MKHLIPYPRPGGGAVTVVVARISANNCPLRLDRTQKLLLVLGLKILLVVCTILLIIELQLGTWSLSLVTTSQSRIGNAYRSWIHTRTRTNGTDKHRPRIVLWTKFYDHYDYTGTGVKLGPEMWADCGSPHCDCEIVYVNTTQELRDDDAIIFHVRNLESHNLPTRRHPNQIWIFFSLESPEHARIPRDHPARYSHVFNWTMTYRQDSDVHYPYGVVTKRSTTTRKAAAAEVARLKEVVANKSAHTRLAGVGMTHCNTPSNRESYIRTLQHYTQADVFGRCSRNLTCGSKDAIRRCRTMECKFAQFSTCYSHLAHTHKFYLSFENSLCVDYVTEKFFMALQYDIVPVVYGSAEYAKVAPPMSYVNAREFGSPSELAKYLNWLDMNPDAYLAYFRWKPYYSVSVSQAVGWCALCRKLRQKQVQRQSYGDIHTWWNTYPFKTPIHGNSAAHRALRPACEKRPNYEYEGWEDARFNYAY